MEGDSKVRINDPKYERTEPLSPSKRKLSRKMVTMMAYLHDDGKYCPRTFNEHCPQHEEDDMKLAEIIGNASSFGGQPMDLNSIPGFPGIGEMGSLMSGGLGQMPGGLGGMSGMDFGNGMMGGDLNLSGLEGDMSLAGLSGPDMGMSMAGLGGDLGAGLGSGLGMGMGMGLAGGFAMGSGGDLGMSGLGGLGSPLNGIEGMGNQHGKVGLGHGVNWPYDAATQMQLTGLSQDPSGGFHGELDELLSIFYLQFKLSFLILSNSTKRFCQYSTASKCQNKSKRI